MHSTGKITASSKRAAPHHAAENGENHHRDRRSAGRDRRPKNSEAHDRKRFPRNALSVAGRKSVGWRGTVAPESPGSPSRATIAPGDEDGSEAVAPESAARGVCAILLDKTVRDLQSSGDALSKALAFDHLLREKNEFTGLLVIRGGWLWYPFFHKCL